jgi:hypothetical protein
MTEKEQLRIIKHRLAIIQHVDDGGRERRGDLPLLRHQSPMLLQVAASLRGRGRGGSTRTIAPAPDLAQRNPERSGGQDHLPAKALSPRPQKISIY